jgi:hypothetical protein
MVRILPPKKHCHGLPGLRLSEVVVFLTAFPLDCLLRFAFALAAAL